MPSPAVTVIVPVLDGGSSLAACLDALAAQDHPRVHVVVVDNGSTDGSDDLARGHHVAPTVLSAAQRGSYAARNVGIAHAVDADVLAFTDADCVPAPDWVSCAVGALQDVDLVGGRVDQQLSSEPSVWERYDAATYLDQRELIETAAFAATANLLVWRRVFDVVGPFDTTLQSSGDLEWCLRATEAGHRLGYAADAVVSHRPRSTPNEIWALHRRLGAGWTQLARRIGGDPWWSDSRLRVPLGSVVDKVAATGEPLRFRELALPHALAMTARLVGRITASV